MSRVKYVCMAIAVGGAVVGALIAFEGREYASTFRLIGLIAVGTCALTAVAMIRARWDRLPLTGAVALSGLVAWDALLGDRQDDDPMTSPLFGYALFDALAGMMLIAALGMTVLGRKPQSGS